MKNLVSALMEDREDWLSFLQEEYKIKAVPSEDGRLVSLKYDQLESPMDVPVVCQCRGMVVDVKSKTVLAWPYDKFWNLGEGRAASVDWSTARVQEKLDGSLLILYWDPTLGEWAVASSGHPTAGGRFGKSETQTFRQAFWDIWSDEGYILPYPTDQGSTFMFELCAEENRVVVKHDRPKLVFHGARSYSGQEYSQERLESTRHSYDWELVKSFPLTSAEECLTAAKTLNPAHAEGYVVVDAQHNRVKIKSPNYVALHHMKGEFSRRRAVELWQTGETSELVLHFPEFAAEIEEVHWKLDAIAEEAWMYLGDIWTARPWPERKEFATIVKDKPFSSVAFKLYGKQNVEEADISRVLKGQTTASLERLLERS